MLKDVSPRLYQESIFATAVQKNSLVVLPTGLGKTLIALMLTAFRLKSDPSSKILFFAPTRPLAEQHRSSFQKHLDLPDSAFALFTGNVTPAKRAALWRSASVIFATPQGIENDIINKSISFKDVSLLIFDEAHRAVGDYSYVFLAKEYHKQAKNPKVLALTASPGENLDKIAEVCTNLGIDGVEVRSPEDPDVAPYVQDTQIKFEFVDLPPEFVAIKKLLEECEQDKLSQVKSLGLLSTTQIHKGELLALQRQLFADMAANRDPERMKAVSLIAEALKVSHALEMLETQGLSQLVSYLDRLVDESRTSKVKAVQNLVRDPRFISARQRAKVLQSSGSIHPKLPRCVFIVQDVLKRVPQGKLIVFSQFRDTGLSIVNALETQGISAKVFVGQQKKGESGMSQKIQAQVLQEFREGLFSVLVATSVAEEGLDIPAVDYVLFYEPVPSAIRSIQRRGRTGRQEEGNVVVLLSRGTRDEAYRWSAHHKEKRMNSLLKTLKSKLAQTLPSKSPVLPPSSSVPSDPNQPTLASFATEESSKPIIFADYREKASPLIKALLDKDMDVRLKQLQVGDFIISEKVAVEYKQADDFVASLLDGRLMPQIKELKRNYWRPILLIEGEQSIFDIRKVHPNSISGMLAAITAGFGIPIIMSRNSQESASIIISLSKRENEHDTDPFSPHGEKKAQSTKEAQEYIVSAIPGIGPTLAKPILKNFKTLKDFVNASEDDLKKIDKIGPQKANTIRRIFDEEYEE